jgi:hypothetical protein
VNSNLEHSEGSVAESRKSPFAVPSPKLDRLIDGVRSLEQWYAVDFERRVAGLTEMLKNKVAQELHAQFVAELDARVERTKKDYDERLAARTREWDLERASLEREIAELRQKVPTQDVFGEIAAAEAAISASQARDLEELMPDAVTLGKLFQSRVQEFEALSYLKGLRFALPEDK